MHPCAKVMSRVWLMAAALCFWCGCGRAQEVATAESVDMDWAIKIPMRDGVELNATVYHPHGQKDGLPVIFTLTPYIGDSYTDRAMYFAKHGYVYALVDVRGRGNSGGKFEPFVNDAHDGYDLVEWFAKQPYCNGKVTMWGGSYAGFDQWDTLKEFPPHLSTIVPAAAAHPGLDFPFQYNIFAPYDMQWLTFTSGKTGNIQTFGNSAYWNQKSREYYQQHLAFEGYDKLVGNPSSTFQKWLQHPTPDAFYDSLVPTAADYSKISIPILTITGDYDGDQPGAFMYYKRHMQYGTDAGKANHYLIIGPWDHAGTRSPKKELGGLTFNDASVLDLNKLHTEWYDWTMKSGKKPEFLKKRIAYYVMAADEWKYADSLETLANGKLTLYLGSNGTAGDLFHSGWLTKEARAGAASDAWVYDPLDTRPGEAENADEPLFITSQAAVANLYGAGAIYHSESFAAATEISGWVKLTAWIKMDVPDTDFLVTLYEILPNGSSVLLTNTTMRARYRESAREEKLAAIGKPEKYAFENFMFFSRRIAEGSRLRLVVESLNSISAEKNYNSDGVVAKETGKDARTAHIELLHDGEHPSMLELPVVK